MRTNKNIKEKNTVIENAKNKGYEIKDNGNVVTVKGKNFEMTYFFDKYTPYIKH